MKRRIGVLAGVVVLLAAAVLGTLTLTKVWDPFGTDVVDRSQPAVLKSLRDLSQFHAAAGDYQVVLDIEQDVRFVPDALAGQRTLFVAAGTVNAFVDFGTMDERSMTVSQESKTVEIDLPSPQLDKPNLQQDKCYVFAQERGLFDRLASLVQAQDQQAFYVAAEQKLAEAAQTSELRKRAVDSTKKMLTGMLGALGYQVSFRGSDD
ncbi:DUF4230 domain-containing protein [Actinosynnema sp.]|uniref:DUF4230 domain-containing protein n=1 Tax=Actinosynnema sp. TaxID=1872144 RepID=UPI003F880253